MQKLTQTEATTTDRHKAEVRAENAASDKKSAAYVADCQRRKIKQQAKSARLVATRPAAAISGMEVMVRRRMLDGEATAKIEAAIVKARKELAGIEDLNKQLAEPVADPVTSAAEAAGKQLFKQTPAGFADLAEAVDYARRKLPLTEARRTSDRIHSTRSGIARRRDKALVAFWEGVEAAAAGCYPTHFSNEALERVIDLGR
jgi:hypothetical protein